LYNLVLLVVGSQEELDTSWETLTHKEEREITRRQRIQDKN
jgi:hypothetical protein